MWRSRLARPGEETAGQTRTTPPVATGYPENTGVGRAVTAGVDEGHNPNLRAPFAMNDGSIVGARAGCACRRNEAERGAC
jgi:hypothetical protein